MNCSYFAIKKASTIQGNKITKTNTKTNTKNKTKKQQTSTQNKTKQNENIQNERIIHYTRSIKYSKKFFLDSKIQHLIQ